ncbi:phage tail tube protein [Pontibaca methylaminivorans]|uniref:Phage major tail protein, TP901-1 family n=1 Tax=Pontibaca methylaminivorans TaxID=515897 RepID=A0A1R3W9S2_9RHOB|nr:phage tail tube protein [Pontibaca methylaminivorans]SIT74749.1 phage major tail protein, TP901-1 family [Pontibaca methylaminivorans]
MARPETIKFGKFFVRLSDGESPPAFTAPCGFTSKSFSRNKTLAEVEVPDCDDPDAAAWSERDVQSMSATISGSGVLAKAAMPTWEGALESTDSIEAEVEFVYADGTSDYYTGRFHIESLEITGSLGERVQVSITMQSDGEIAYERTDGS